MCKLSKKFSLSVLILAVFAVTVLATTLSAQAAGVKIIYQSPPDGIKLDANSPNQDIVPVLAVGGYTSIRVVAHVRASSLGTGKVEVRLDHADSYLAPNAASPKIIFPLWSKTLANDAYVSTLIDKPGANLKLNTNVAAAPGEFYYLDVFVYGFK